MKKLTILCTTAIAGIFLAGPLYAVGNARTLTTGIGAGTVPSGVPNNHPYLSKRQSTNTRNYRAGISIDNFRTGGFSNRPDSTSSTSSASIPTSIPGNIPGDSHAASVVPSGIGGGSRAGFATPPTTIPGNIPSGGTAIGSIPPTIGGIPSSAPALIPALSVPDAASAGISAAQAGLDRRGNGRPE